MHFFKIQCLIGKYSTRNKSETLQPRRRQACNSYIHESNRTLKEENHGVVELS